MSEFSSEKYAEFVGLYKDPEEGHKTLMGIGQQMLTNADLAKRLRMGFKSQGDDAGQGAGEGDATQVDMEFFLTAIHDEIQQDPALAQRLGLVASKEEEASPAGSPAGDPEGETDDDAAVQSQEQGYPEPAAVAGFKEKAAALIDEVFGRPTSAVGPGVPGGPQSFTEVAAKAGAYGGYDEEPYEDEDQLTLSGSHVGDGVGIGDLLGGDGDDGFDDGSFADKEALGQGVSLDEFATVVTREAAKAAGGVSRELAMQMGDQLQQLTGVVSQLAEQVAEMDHARRDQVAADGEQLSAVKETVANLRSQYQLLDDALPPMANFDRLRVDKAAGAGYQGGIWGNKSAGDSDQDADDYDDQADGDWGTFVDPLVQDVFGVANSW